MPFLPLYANSMGATGIGLGVIFAGFSVSRAIFMPVIGRLSDRRGRKLFICLGLLIYAIISLGYIWANSVLQLIMVRLIQGAAAGMIMPIAQAYIGDISPEGEEGKWMGYFHTAFFAGFGIGPLMGGILVDRFGMTGAFYSMGSLNLIAFLVAALFLPEISHQKAAARSHSSFRKIISSGMVKGLSTFRLVFSLGMGAFACFMPIFATMHIGLSPTLIGIPLTVNMLLMSVFQPYAGKIADRFNRRALVVIGSLISITFLALIPVTLNFWQLLGICAFGGLGGAISMPAASALLVEEGRRFGMGSTTAIFMMAMSIGIAVGSLLGGVMADFVNINSVFYCAAGVGLIGTGLFIWFSR